MEATLYPWLRCLPPGKRYGIMVVISDANWAMAMQRFERGKPGFGVVLVALLAPMAVGGDNGARLALLTTAVIMLVLKRPLLAIAGGIVAAAVWRLGVG